ncbi:transportin-3-like, partial [Nilaparvata lugens]
MWPVLSATFNKYLPDVRTMERCGRVVKFAIRCVGRQSAHLLEPIVKQILSLYNQYQHSCFLYLGSVLVTEFANEPGCIEGLDNMMQAFITPTFTLLQENNGLKNHPDTVEDFFRLCS